MKRNWIMAYGMFGAFALSGMSMAQEASKNEEKKEEKKAEVTVKTTGKIILVGPDGKVTEKSFGDGEIVEGKAINVEVKGKDGEEKEIVIVTQDGKKKTITLNRVDVTKSETKDVEGKKTIKLEAKVVGGEGGEKTIILSGDGKTFDVKGVGIDVEKIKKLVEEKKGDLKPEDIQALLKTVEGKPLGGAIRLHVQNVEGHPHVFKVEGKPHVVVEGHPHVVVEGKALASASGSSDLGGKLDKILDRLEKLEERLSKLEKED